MRKYFKPHIVSSCDGYRIRKFTLIWGWTYLDQHTRYWWLSENEWSLFETLEEAKERYSKYKQMHYL